MAKALSSPRKKTTSMTSFFDGTKDMEDMGEIYESLEANCPCPSSTSMMLWKLRRKLEISDRNDRKETILEKAVAMLAENEHMPGWFNQCPAASGIVDSAKDRKTDAFEGLKPVKVDGK